MNEYAGKICPFCKTEIMETDEVMVCPACSTPHHKGCWDENKGCTTFGCSEQHYVAQGTNPTDVCKKCGAALGDGQEFCPKCGAPKNAPQALVCSKCGTELMEGQEFCPKCGQKAGFAVDSSVGSAIAQFNETQAKKNKKKILVPIIAIVVVLALIGGGIAIVPKLLIDTEGYIEKGDYEKAYAKAKTDEEKQMVADAYMAKGDYRLAYDRAPNDSSKKMVMLESIAAERSAYSANNLKDPSSFKLRDIYYHETKYDSGKDANFLVLYIQGANSYGANISSYWLYDWDDEKNQFTYFCSVSDLSKEDYSKYDDWEESLQKAIDNSGRTYISNAMSNGIHFSKDAVQRINNLFEEEKLEDVDPIEFSK